MRTFIIVEGLITLLLVVGSQLSMRDASQDPSDAVRAFERNVAEYVSLRNRLDRSLPALDANSTAGQIDSHRDALLALLATARIGAKKGDVFGAAMSDYTRARVRPLLEGPDGAQIRQSVMDTNPTTAVVEINRRYPFAIPLSRMPAVLLKVLPPLPEGLEYHFVGNRLVLLDTSARMVVDVMDNILTGGHGRLELSDGSPGSGVARARRQPLDGQSKRRHLVLDSPRRL